MDGRNRLYGDLSHLWPLMSPPDHYDDEARYWLRELRSRLAPGKRRILDLGTGGGHHLHPLTTEFDINRSGPVGSDALTVASVEPRRRPPRRGYADSPARRDVRRRPRPRRHLLHDDRGRLAGRLRNSPRPTSVTGGLLIVAPDDYAETFKPPQVEYQTNRNAETELTYVEYSTDLDPTDTSPSRRRTCSSSRRATSCRWRWTAT